MDKRSQLPAVEALDRMISACAGQITLLPEDYPLLLRFLLGIRHTGDADLTLLNLLPGWFSQSDKSPCHRVVIELARGGISAAAVLATLEKTPGLYPKKNLPSERTIRRWISSAKSSGVLGHEISVSSADEDDDP